MGFEIKINTGEQGEVWLRGCGDGTVEMCTWGTLTPLKGQDPNEIREGLIPFKYYASPEQAFNKILRMRIGSANASSLAELITAIKQIRQDIKQEMGIL